MGVNQDMAREFNDSRTALYAIRKMAGGYPTKLLRCADEDAPRWAPPFVIDGVPYFLALLMPEKIGARVVCFGADDTSWEWVGDPTLARSLWESLRNRTTIADLTSAGFVPG